MTENKENSCELLTFCYMNDFNNFARKIFHHLHNDNDYQATLQTRNQ